MKILYVTGLWSGFRDVIFDGEKDAKGMPAFIRPLSKLIKCGDRIDVALLCKEDMSAEMHDNARKFGIDNLHPIKWRPGWRGIYYSIQALIRLQTLIRREKYDFVYGHGTIGALPNIICLLHNIPFGQRIYGTFLSKFLNKSRIAIFLSHPLEYLCFSLRKKFLIVTNDGTKGDVVQSKIGSNKYDFFFPLNGVDKEHKEKLFTSSRADDSFEIIFYPARVARWKQQHLALDMLQCIRNQGINAKLLFSGHIADREYLHEIMESAKERDLVKHVSHSGVLSKEEMRHLYATSMATLSFYDVSNLGNVLIEAMAAGAIVCSLDDGSLDGVINNNDSGIIGREIQQIANDLVAIHKDPSRNTKMREQAKKAASTLFLSWDERASWERNIIQENSVKSSNPSV